MQPNNNKGCKMEKQFDINFFYEKYNESIPYFMLDREMLLKIAKLLF